jgi:hypothetical protein
MGLVRGLRVLVVAVSGVLVALLSGCGNADASVGEEDVTASDSALAAPPITLRYFSSVVMHDYHWDQLNAQVDLRVKDAACAGVAMVHLTEDGASWTDVAATRLGAAGAGYSLYRATVSHPWSGTELRFALRCNEGTRAVWNNNGGADFRFAGQTGWVLRSGNVYNSGYTAGIFGAPGTLSGSIALRNLAFAKRVTVVFSTDGWRTVQTSDAKYRTLFYTPGLSNPNALGNEAWDFNLPIGDAARVDYAIAYLVNGQTFWDNNFGANYFSVR